MKPTHENLLEANARFYKVVESLDYETMELLWEPTERIYCIHPGWAPLSGKEKVLNSWKDIFSGAANMHFELSQIEIRLEGQVGIITLFERITTKEKNQSFTATAAATNIFVATPEGWKMILHQAAHSPKPPEIPSVLN